MATSNNYKFQRPERPCFETFLHCSASSYPEHDDITVINQWHLDKGFSGVGYHFFIKFNGELQIGRTLEKQPAAQAGNNTGTIAICLHGLKAEDFTQEQFETLKKLCNQINDAYNDSMVFRGHCEVDNRDCPVFNYQKVLNLDEHGKIKAFDFWDWLSSRFTKLS